MPVSSLVRWRASAALVASGAVAGTMALTVAPAHALIEYGDVSASGSTYGYVLPNTNSTKCTLTLPAAPSSKDIRDNGETVSNSQSRVGKLVHPSKATDISDVAIAGAAVARSTPITAAGGSIRFTGRASASVKHRLATSSCSASATSYSSVDASIQLPVGMWVSLSASGSKSGDAGIQVYLQGSDNGDQLAVAAGSARGQGSATGYVPAGEYRVSAEASASAYIGATGTKTSSVSGAATVTFTPGGAASAASGKGKSYVALGARSCTSHAVVAGLTKKARTKAKKVIITVNGRKRVGLAGTKLRRTSSVSLTSLAPTSTAKVVATIVPKRGKKVTVTRTYRACW